MARVFSLVVMVGNSHFSLQREWRHQFFNAQKSMEFSEQSHYLHRLKIVGSSIAHHPLPLKRPANASWFRNHL
jgi:hypothetical protein